MSNHGEGFSSTFLDGSLSLIKNLKSAILCAFRYAGYPYGLTYGAGVAATSNVLGHAIAYNAGGVTHSSSVGVLVPPLCQLF